MTFRELTISTLAKQFSHPFDSIELVNWSIEILKLGYESDDLYILAGSKLRDDLIKKSTGQPAELEQIKYLDEAITKMSNIPLVREKIFFRAFKSTLVNCWHQNEFESEAMWRLYSENNKGIAIQTTLQRHHSSQTIQLVKHS